MADTEPIVETRPQTVVMSLRNYVNFNSTAPYVIAIGIAMLAVLIRMPLTPWIGPTRAAFLIPLCAIIFMAMFYGFFPAIVTEIVALIASTFFILPPQFSFEVTDPEVRANMVTFAVGAFASAIFGHFVYRTRQARDEQQKSAEALQARLAAIVDSSRDAVISKNLDTIITSWNAGAERLFGYTAEEAVGRSIRMLIPEDRQDEETEIIGRIGRGESIDHYETERLRKNGTLIPISLTVSPIRSSNGVIIGASKIARDITPQKLAEQRIADDLKAMTRLRNIGELSARADCDIELCLDAILDAAIDFTRAAKGNIQLMRPAENVLEIATHSSFSDRFLNCFAAVHAGEMGACGAALRKGRRVIVHDIRESDIFVGKPSLEILLDEGILAVQSTPLISSTGRVLGIISTHFSEPHTPDERLLGLLDLLARQAADMIERRNTQERLEQEVIERTRALNEAKAALENEAIQ